jgi:Leucine-rich repeat (LRR) protein
MQSLTKLDVHSTHITDIGMSTIGNLKSLTDLNIACTRVSDAGMSRICQLKNLKRLKMESTDITGKSLQYLKDLPLEELTLELKPSELKYLASLSKLNKLKYMHLKTEHLTDSDLEYFKCLPNLDTLYISGAKFSSNQRLYLEKLGKFKDLFT